MSFLKTSPTNLTRLKKAISFFSYLNAQGEISDEAYKYLVRYACSIFLENEVAEKVESALEGKFSIFLESKFFPAIEKSFSRDENLF